MLVLSSKNRCLFGFILTAVLAGCGKQSSPAPTNPKADPPATDSRLVLAPGVTDEKYVGPLADAYRRVDPDQDGWQTEVIGAEVLGQLQQLQRSLQNGTFSDTQSWGSVASDGLQMDDLIPSELETVYQQGPIVVQRMSDASDLGQDLRPSQPASERGQQVLPQKLRILAAHFRDEQVPHVKFKVVRVEPADRETQTLVYFHADGPGADGQGLLEMSATWRCRWTLGADGQPPLLLDVRVEDFESVMRTDRAEPLFADCTASLLQHEPAYRRQLLRGTDYWRSRICRDLGVDVVANHGLALADVNGDLLEDIYLCQQGGLPNRLFLQERDGTLRDATAESGADWLDYCASALLVDLDNNGDADLVVGQETRVVIMQNDGSGKFRVAYDLPASAQVFSMSAADYDRDGDLDIYICGYNPMKARARTGAMGEPIPFHDAQNGGENMLLRNDGDWQFTNVVNEVGMGANNNRFSFAAAWEDFDNDGDVDLYVANDYGRNNLYRNDAGMFQDVAGEFGVEDMSAGMAVSWADFNRDGWMDFYVSNMFSAAGNRITYQRQFQSEASHDTKQGFQRHARGNSLFANTGGTDFRDVSVSARVTMGRWAWGNRFVDLNNDGWQDLVVANGFISTEDTGDL